MAHSYNANFAGKPWEEPPTGFVPDPAKTTNRHGDADSDSDSDLPLYRHERLYEAVRWNTIKELWTRGLDGPPIHTKGATLFPRTITHHARRATYTFPFASAGSNDGVQYKWEPVEPYLEIFKGIGCAIFHPPGYLQPGETPSYPPPGEKSVHRPFKPTSLCEPIRYLRGAGGAATARTGHKVPKVIDGTW
jgi:hypothetical protein